MDITKFEIRFLLKPYWRQDFKAASATRRICEVEAEDVVSERMAQRWFQRFNIGEEILIRCQNNLVHEKIPYITRLRHLENNREAVDMYLMN